jgi:hypothetical protein
MAGKVSEVKRMRESIAVLKEKKRAEEIKRTEKML